MPRINQAKNISVVVTIYNKAEDLPDMLASLCQQDGLGEDFFLEFVLVDDASRDHSLAVAKSFLDNHPVTVKPIANDQNVGPSIRLNQGINAAQGDYILICDADDITPRNLLRTMIEALDNELLDYVYGRSQKTRLSPDEATSVFIPLPANLQVSTDPLLFTLRENIVHPIVLTKREVALHAGGSDEKVFIQDESLALRLALVARRIGLLCHPCRYVITAHSNSARTGQKHLSANLAQQHHDQYWTCMNFLQEPSLSKTQKAAIARKAIAPWWKSVRGRGFHPVVLCCYLLSKVFPQLVLKWADPIMANHFASLPNVRRIGQRG